MVDVQGTEYSSLLEATSSTGAEYGGTSYLHSLAGATDIGAGGLASIGGIGGSYAAESFEAYSEGGMGSAGMITGGVGGVDLAGAGALGGGYSTFESVSGTATDIGLHGHDVAGIGGIAGIGLGAGAAGGSYESGYYSSTVSGGEAAGIGGMGGALVAAGGGGFGAGGFGTGGHVLPLSAYKIQEDASPLVVRRAYTGGATTYRQNIMVRFLKPPTPPAPGPLIIKEIRPPQPKPAPPLVIRQRPPRPPTPPPLVLRERPPRMPAVVKTQTIIKKLPALPAPPRQVIIERYPALPPKPRDVIIERWLQYGPMPKRRVIYQRAAAARAHRTAKNLIIQYEAPRPHVQRIFRRLGVVSMNPSSYASTYGASLLDSGSLVSAARNAGVIENISPPALVYPTASSLAAAGLMQAGGGAAGMTTFEAGGAGMIAGAGAAESFSAGYEAVYGGGAMGVGGAEHLGTAALTGSSLYSVGGEGLRYTSEVMEEATPSGGSFEYSATSVEMGGGVSGAIGGEFVGGVSEAGAEIGGEIAGMNIEGGGASYESSASYTAMESTA